MPDPYPHDPAAQTPTLVAGLTCTTCGRVQRINAVDEDTGIALLDSMLIIGPHATCTQCNSQTLRRATLPEILGYDPADWAR